MNKTAFTFVAITILSLTSFIPVAENVTAEEAKEAKTMEVPVQIYTLHGIKEIRKELPINEAMKLQKMAYEAKEAMETLFNKNASFMERTRANEIIDSFLYEMKRNELFGNLTIKEAKELITGKYFMKQRNSMEMQRFNAIAKFFQQNGWQVNAICYFNAWGGVVDLFPWNIFLYILFNLLPDFWLVDFIILLIVFPDLIPHLTTLGYWDISWYGIFAPSGGIYIRGLLGEERVDLEGTETIKAITVGFTGINIFLTFAIGFCPFIAYKHFSKS